MPSEDDIRRFMSYVKKTKTCWLWIGGKSGSGYAFFTYKGRSVKASRFILEATNGPLSKDAVVCHNCDVKACVNPLHLFVGTAKDNYLDRVMPPPLPQYTRALVNKSVNNCEVNGMAKLSRGKVLLIKAMHATGRFTQTEIASGLGVNVTTIHRVIKGETWRHVKPSRISG